VALGGTFDHLHAGHKILLSMTAWISSHRVVCGVTDDAMLKTKKFKEFMEPLDKRIEAVERFLRIFKRGLVYEVVPISDMYGPTITDDKLEALMVSKETLKGGGMVNQERRNRNLPPLTIEVINVISPTETQVDEVSLKISSTFIRQYLSEQASNSHSNKFVEHPNATQATTASSEAAH
ncbi:Nucleotidylyl transferase, partial [Linnemannia elongata AG-77]